MIYLLCKYNLKKLTFENCYVLDVPDAVLFYLLHAILPLSTHSRLNKKNKMVCSKYTILESQNAFILVVQKPFNLNETINKIRTDAAAKKSTLQPFIIALGKNLFEAKHFYCYYDGVICKFNSIVAAIDCCFKTFFVFNLIYPPECYNFWLFIQREIFKLTLKYDNTIPSLLRLMEDFKNQKKMSLINSKK